MRVVVLVVAILFICNVMAKNSPKFDKGIISEVRAEIRKNFIHYPCIRSYDPIKIKTIKRTIEFLGYKVADAEQYATGPGWADFHACWKIIIKKKIIKKLIK